MTEDCNYLVSIIMFAEMANCHSKSVVLTLTPLLMQTSSLVPLYFSTTCTLFPSGGGEGGEGRNLLTQLEGGKPIEDSPHKGVIYSILLLGCPLRIIVTLINMW